MTKFDEWLAATKSMKQLNVARVKGWEYPASIWFGDAKTKTERYLVDYYSDGQPFRIQDLITYESVKRGEENNQ